MNGPPGARASPQSRGRRLVPAGWTATRAPKATPPPPKSPAGRAASRPGTENTRISRMDGGAQAKTAAPVGIHRLLAAPASNTLMACLEGMPWASIRPAMQSDQFRRRILRIGTVCLYQNLFGMVYLGFSFTYLT